MAEVGADPGGFGGAGSYEGFCAAEAETLDGTDKPFLPAIILAADGIVATFRHPMDIPTPQGGPPKAGLPGAVDPDLIRRPQPADASPSSGRHLVPFSALLAHYKPGDVGCAVPLLPTGANMEYLHTVRMKIKLQKCRV